MYTLLGIMQLTLIKVIKWVKINKRSEKYIPSYIEVNGFYK